MNTYLPHCGWLGATLNVLACLFVSLPLTDYISPGVSGLMQKLSIHLSISEILADFCINVEEQKALSTKMRENEIGGK